MIFIVSSLAFAGKLEAGWRGRPYGTLASLTEAPLAGASCTSISRDDSGVWWMCSEKIGAEVYTVNYIVDQGYYLGILIECSSSTSCDNLRMVLTAAWGTPRDKSDSESWWADNTVAASWKINGFSHKGQVAVIHIPSMKAAEAKKTVNAARAAQDL